MASNNLTKENFCCPVCLNLLNDPVTLPCGHNYCMECIKNVWDRVFPNHLYSCPECRKTFTVRPALHKNPMLAEVVEKLERTGLEPTPPEHFYAGPGDVPCDICTEKKLRAVKSCLGCMVSYCDSHLKPHFTAAPLKRHKLVDPTKILQENICLQHNKALEIYCLEDGMCICYLCAVDEHQHHDKISAVKERTERQEEVTAALRQAKQRIQEKNMELEQLTQTKECFKKSEQDALEHCDRHFTELICSLRRQCSKVKEQISMQVKTAVFRAEREEGRLKQNLIQLCEKNTRLEEISNTQDPIFFLKHWQPACDLGEADPKIVVVQPQNSFFFVKKAIIQLKDQVEEICSKEVDTIFQTVKEVHVTTEPIPHQKLKRATSNVSELRSRKQFFNSLKHAFPESLKPTRAYFLQYYCSLTLDPDTANKALFLTEENRKAMGRKLGVKVQRCPSKQQRFNFWEQVLCKEVLSEARYYWEVEWSGKNVIIGVTYSGICRKGRGPECGLGCNVNSWALHFTEFKYSAWHNNEETDINIHVSSPRVGVYVDHREGTLSFYSVSNTMNLLHTFKTEFSEPLHPGFGVGCGSTLKLCQLKQD